MSKKNFPHPNQPKIFPMPTRKASKATKSSPITQPVVSSQKYEDLVEDIKLKVEKLRKYTPKVGVFGNSGVGKSSLCNALFGGAVAEISSVEACTRKAQHITIGATNGSGGITLVDVPGIGEDPARQHEYTELYKKLAPDLDLVLWLIKSDDRNYACSIDAYSQVFNKPDAPPVVFVITQTDKTNDSEDWNYEEYKPGGSQIKNLLTKEHDVSKRFSIPTNRIISIATSAKRAKNYNIKNLVDLIVEVLPNEKKYSFTREAKEGNVSDEARKSAEKGIWDSVKEYAGAAWESVKEKAVDVIIASAPKIISKITSWFSSWW